MRRASFGPTVRDVQRDAVASNLGDALTVALAERQTSQTALAKRLRCSQATVSTWCRGTAVPTVPQLVRIEQALALRPGDLMRRAGLVQPLSVSEAVEVDPALDETARQQMRAIYEELMFATVRRRQGKGDGSSPGTTAVVGSSTAHEIAAALTARLAPALAAAIADVPGLLPGSPTARGSA